MTGLDGTDSITNTSIQCWTHLILALAGFMLTSTAIHYL